jgi:hypothetical protein
MNFIRQKIPVANSGYLEYSAVMNKRGTIADITKWAEASLPGEEARARSVIVGCRKADLFTKGGHGRNAPFMKLTDFPTAVLAVLHAGQVTKVDEAVKLLWSLPLSLITLETSDERSEKFTLRKPNYESETQTLIPYFDHLGFRPSSLSRPGSDNLIGIMTTVFANVAPNRDFHPYDYAELKSCGEDVNFSLTLHGADYFHPTGIPVKGPSAGAITLSFGGSSVHAFRGVTTTRRIGARALNALSLMTPNLTKAAV